MRLRFLSAALSLSVLFAAFQFPASAASEPSITSGILSSLATAFGVTKPDGVYCVNCGEKVSLDNLESGLLSAVCPSCDKSVFLNSDGKVSVGGFSGFGGGGSRGGGAGLDPVPVVGSNGDISFPLFFIKNQERIGLTIYPTSLYYEYAGSSSASGTARPILWWGLSSNYPVKCYFYAPISGDYQVRFTGTVWSDYEFKYSCWASSSSYAYYTTSVPLNLSWTKDLSSCTQGLSYTVSLPGLDYYTEGATSVIRQATCPYDSVTSTRYPIYGTLSAEVVLISDYDYPDITSPSVDNESSTIIIGSTSIPYQSIYKYGDTYITYNNDQSTVYYTDQSGAILGSCVFDNSTNTFQITDFSSNPPTPTPSPAPTPVPSAAPQPSASPVPSSAPQPSASPGGSGGSDSGGSDSGGSDSGSGIWGGIADAIAGLLSAIGTLIGGILKGFIDLLSNMLGTVTSALPLISDVAALISGLYSFLPEDWQTILTAAFSLLLTFSVVKLVLGVMGK